jgi:hypothetical protein
VSVEHIGEDGENGENGIGGRARMANNIHPLFTTPDSDEVAGIPVSGTMIFTASGFSRTTSAGRANVMR